MASWSEYLKPEVIARFASVGLHSHTAVEGTVSGLHRSPLKGVSPEFNDYREYSFGDDLKNLDWRAYARSDRFYIKRYEEESNLRAWLLVDASASMTTALASPCLSTSTREMAFQRANSTQDRSRNMPLA